MRRKAFDPFFTTRRDQGFTGLGLHIVHSIVTNYLGGRIQLESEPGAGTTIQLVLPAYHRRPPCSSAFGAGVREQGMDRRNFIAGCAALSLTAKAGDAFGQSGPLTRIIFPFAAGGGGDALCRLVAQHLGPSLDRSVIVENRTGGDGLIGIKSVKGASARRRHDSGDHRPDHVSAADDGGHAEF